MIRGKMIRRKMVAVIAAILVGMFAGCGSQNQSSGSVEEINIAYQYGLAYAPVVISMEKEFIEQRYEELTGEKITVTWTQMNSGADINTGITSGNIDVGFMGIAPAITGCMNKVGYKIFTNVSGQEHGLMSNSEEIQTLGDLVGSGHQIALVNTGSIQHIILARALDHAGYDPHALDSNIVAMKHPDGMNAVQTGNVKCHLTTNPYLLKERTDSSLHEIPEISEVWSEEESFIVGVASEKIHNENPELYQAICDAINQAIELINSDIESAASITYELDGNLLEEEINYMSAGKYSVETTGVFELAKFMGETGFIDTVPESYEELVFENVSGN